MNPAFSGSQGLTKAPGAMPAPRILPVTFAASGTWRAPANGFIAVLLLGAGGSGAIAGTSTAVAARAVGGGAGGMSYKLRRVRRGDTFRVIIGAGGASRSAGAPGTVAGLPGSASTFSGPGVSMQCLGGQGGTSTTASNAALAGALGGAAYGGDINLQGGASGDIAAVTLALGLATGGGGPNLLGLPCSGGAITAATNLLATGGGGAASSGVAGSTLGGTAGGAGLPTNANLFWPSNDLFYDLIRLAGVGGAGNANASSAAVTDIGSGSGGVRQATSNSLTSGSAVLGGTGGIASDGQTIVGVGAPAYGGGSGGLAASTMGVSGTLTVAAGGQGLCLLAFYPGE